MDFLQNKKLLLVIGLGGLAVAVIVVIMVVNQVVAVDSVRLPNGKVASIGQSERALLQAMGSDISESLTEPGVYRYPAGSNRSDVNIYVVDGRVVAVMAARNEETRQLGSDISVGASRSQLTSSFGKKLLEINTQLDVVKHKGYKVINARNVSYYVTSTCLQNAAEKVTVLAVAKKGFSDRMAYLTQPLQCRAPANPSS